MEAISDCSSITIAKKLILHSYAKNNYFFNLLQLKTLLKRKNETQIQKHGDMVSRQCIYHSNSAIRILF